MKIKLNVKNILKTFEVIVLGIVFIGFDLIAGYGIIFSDTLSWSRGDMALRIGLLWLLVSIHLLHGSTYRARVRSEFHYVDCIYRIKKINKKSDEAIRRTGGDYAE